eukprot:TRINITY_DN24345_c0_g1_i2.p1 TRINITY_DN24345_c0_g1~~TRINITY_DN24345_c0_g1_i2.p1  ORF type:complete len:695 (+),score=279.11 TRINITY_DN24345_c0_g1_i2:28-2112(+)
MGVIEQLHVVEEEKRRMANDIQALQIERSELLNVIDSVTRAKNSLEMSMHQLAGASQSKEEQQLNAINELNNIIDDRNKSIQILKQAVDAAECRQSAIELEHLRTENTELKSRLSNVSMGGDDISVRSPRAPTAHTELALLVKDLERDNVRLREEIGALESLYTKKTDAMESTINELMTMLEAKQPDSILYNDSSKMGYPSQNYSSAAALTIEAETAREQLALHDKITELETLNKKLASALEAAVTENTKKEKAHLGSHQGPSVEQVDRMNIERSEMQAHVEKLLTSGIDVEGTLADMKTAFNETLVKVQDNNTHLHSMISHTMTLQKLLKADNDEKTRQLQALAAADDSVVMQLLEENSNNTSTVTSLELRITDLMQQVQVLENELSETRTELEAVLRSVTTEEPSIAVVNILKGLLEHSRSIAQAAVKECNISNDVVSRLQVCLEGFEATAHVAVKQDTCRNCSQLHAYVSDMEDLIAEKEELIVEMQKEGAWHRQQQLERSAEENELSYREASCKGLEGENEMLTSQLQHVTSEKQLLSEKWDVLVQEHATSMELTKIALKEAKIQCDGLKQENKELRECLSRKGRTTSRSKRESDASDIDTLLVATLRKWNIRHTASSTKELVKCVTSLPITAVRDAVELLSGSLDIGTSHDLTCYDLVPQIMKCINVIKGRHSNSRDPNAINTQHTWAV